MYYIPVSYASCFLLVMFNLMVAPIPLLPHKRPKGFSFLSYSKKHEYAKTRAFPVPGMEMRPIRPETHIWVIYLRKHGVSSFEMRKTSTDLFMQTSLHRVLLTNLFLSARRTLRLLAQYFICDLMFCVFYLLWYLIFLFNCI